MTLQKRLVGLARRARSDSGQVVMITALMMVVFIAFLGTAVDYGFLLADRTALQNATDAASLAAAQTLVAGGAPNTSGAKATALQYLNLHGFQQDASTAIAISFPPTPGNNALQSVAIQVNRNHPTLFMYIIGITSIPMQIDSTASAGIQMVDVMFSLDLTGSMQLSGTNDVQNLQNAVVAFINQMNLDPNNPLGSKVGMARFAGIMCQWVPKSGYESFIHLGPGPSEYGGTCSDDMTLLSNLTSDPRPLLQLANASGGVGCPAGMNQYACPLTSWQYTAQAVGTYASTAWHPPSGMQYAGQWEGGQGLAPAFTGTKEPNGIKVVNNPSSGYQPNPSSGYYAWSESNGGRNNLNGEGYAHKVLVLITDGQDELWPVQGNPQSGNGGVNAWDNEWVARANALKAGPDGVVGTPDDVEIYTVGFFCTPYSASSQYPQIPSMWCKSQMADMSPHPCPSATWNASKASSIDTLLWEVSSSSPGTCDHYFPIRKTEDLPKLFTQLGNAIAWPRLTQ